MTLLKYSVTNKMKGSDRVIVVEMLLIKLEKVPNCPVI